MTAAVSLDTPVFINAGDEDLFGVITSPEGKPTGPAVLVLFGAGDFPSPGKNQVRARLARQLAALGYHVLRFDYQGVGDSGGALREDKDLDPSDALAAARWLVSQGFDRIFVVGVCWGAVVSLDVLAEIPEVAGMALVGLPVVASGHREVRMSQRRLSWYLKRGASLTALRLILGRDAVAKRRRATLKESILRTVKLRRTPAAGPSDAAVESSGESPAEPSAAASAGNARLVERVGSMLKSGAPILLLYGRQDAFYAGFEQARQGRLGKLLEAAGSRVNVQVEDGALVSMASIEDQEKFLSAITAFAGGLGDTQGSSLVGRAPSTAAR